MRLFRIYLLTKEGEKIGEVGRAHRYHLFSWPIRKILTAVFGPVKGSGYSHDECFRENLEAAARRLQPASNKTQFVLNVDGYYSTLYKVPKGRSMEEQLQLKKDEAQTNLAKFLQDN